MVKNTLLQFPVGARLQITGCEGGRTLSARLRQYGLFVGDQARLLRRAPFSGPILIEVNGREIALSREIAARITVDAI